MAALVVSLDARQIAPTKRNNNASKSAVQTSDGKIQSKVVAVDADKVDVRFDVDQKATLQVAVGPADAADDELLEARDHHRPGHPATVA